MTAAATSLLEPRYQTRSTIVLKPFDSRVSGADVQIVPVELTRSIVETQLDVLRSRAFAADVAQALGLFDDPHFAPMPDPATMDSEAERKQRVVDKLLASYSVFRSGESLAVDIVARSANAQLAANMANTVASTYISTTFTERTASIDQVINFLQDRVSSLGDELTQSELKMAEFIRDNNLDDIRLQDRLRSDVDHLTRILSVGQADTPNSDEAVRVKGALERTKNALQAHTRAELTQSRMEKGLELLRTRYESAVERLNEMETQRKFIEKGAQQISIAHVPPEPTWPNVPTALAISGSVAFVLAFVVALLREGLDRRIWNDEQVSRCSGVANAGFVPMLAPLPGDINAERVIPYLQDKPHSVFAESLRSIVTPWLTGDTDCRIVMVTSGLPGEGKSLAALSLAGAAVIDGLKVLLIGLDDRSSNWTVAPGTDVPTYAAAELLEKENAPVPLQVNGVPVEGLDIVRIDAWAPGGGRNRLRMLAELKSEMQGSYDLVLVDTPAILIADLAGLFSPLADEILHVVRWGNTTEDQLCDSLDRLETLGLEVSATVINDVDFRRHQRLGYGGQAQYLGQIGRQRSESVGAIGPHAALTAFFLALAALPQGARAQAAGAEPFAFPGATGFGEIATGWRGGNVVPVTSLADHGPGSLRACAANSAEPRVCIFRVSGTIALESPIYVGPNVYIAGQTAPGDGIQIRTLGSLGGPLILKNTHDVVIRFLKIRPGPSRELSPGVDAVTVENGQRIYLGNLSMAFATDETFNVHVSSAVSADITLADSLLALSLDHSTHPKGRHSKGALICSSQGTGVQCGRITLVRNLFAHHRDRNPDLKATAIGPVEVINNIFFDPISQFGEFYDLLGETRIAYVGNVALTGPSTISKPPEAVQVFDWNDDTDIGLFVRDNLAGSDPGCHKHKVELLDPVARDHLIGGVGWVLSTPPMPVGEVLNAVLARAGDRLPDGRHRDSLDARVVTDVLECTGHVIDTVDEVGGWPELAEVQAEPDSDGDGLPDAFENAHPGLDPDVPSDPWAIPTGHTLSYLEIWLAGLAGDQS